MNRRRIAAELVTGDVLRDAIYEIRYTKYDWNRLGEVVVIAYYNEVLLAAS